MDKSININSELGINKNLQYLAYGCNSTYNYANNPLFYAFINSHYKNYYLRSVKENLEWYDGFVDNFHNVENGIFSTQLANSLCNGIAKQVIGSNLMFKNTMENVTNKSLDFITNKWNKEICNFRDVCKLAIEYSGASGTSLIKINQSHKDFWCEALRQDQFYFTTDSKGKLTELNSFIKSYVANEESKEPNYMLVESRYFKEVEESSPVKMLDGKVKYYSKTTLKPFVEYKVFRYQGQINNNINYNQVEKGLKWQDIPNSFKRILKRDYTAIRVNEPMKLPFNDLGCELIMVGGRDGQVPFGRFGKSWLSNIRVDLIEYDLMNAYEIRDMYNGQGQVGVPKALSQGDLQGNNNVYSQSKLNYETYIGDPNTQKPIITQFDLRVDQWERKKDDILKRIATKLGVSPKNIASYLADSIMQKTATQVKSDDFTGEEFINEARSNIETPINAILKTICLMYGHKEPIAIRFSANVPTDYHQLLEDTDFEYQNGYIDLRQALTKLNPNASESQLDELEKRARTRQEELRINSVGMINEDGAFEDDRIGEEPTTSREDRNED